MEQQNLDSQIQKIFSQFNNKEYQIVINQCVNLINLNHKVPVIYNLLGTSLLFIQEYKKALKFYNLGKELDPNNEELLRNIGKCNLSLKNYADAEISFKKALGIKKNNPDTLFNLGVVNLLSGHTKKSINYLNEALNLNPSFTECLYNLGLCYKNLGENKNAITFYNKAISLNPNHLKSYNNRAVCYLILNDYEKALDSLNSCLLKNPNYSYALNNLGSVYIALKNHKEAEICFSKAYSLNKNLLNAGVQKIYLKRKNCDWSSEDEINQLMNDTITIEENVAPWQCLAMEDKPLNHLLRAKKFSRQFQLKSQNKKIHNNKKIRIGYFALDFYQHPGMVNMLGIFKNHNKDKFQIIGFYYGNIKKDNMHYNIKSYFDEFYYVDQLNDEEIADLAKKTKIDIAINRSGHTDKARGNIFAYKPAPIQINYLGYAGTLGQEGMDYIISDKFVVPDGNENFYSEKIIYLNKCFYPQDDNRKISTKSFSRSDLNLTNDDFIFCSFNNSYKITSEEFTIWMQILKKVKKSYLVLLSNNIEMQDNIRKEAVKHNTDPMLIKFVEYVNYEDHMARHKIFDLFLDSFNYNAHTSAVDSLWAELPILTNVGSSFSSRICGSILNSLGFSNLITYSKKEYEKKAIYFGNNKKEILKIKNSIIESKEKKMFYDIKKYTLKLEKAYQKAHSLRLEKKKPINFEIN